MNANITVGDICCYSMKFNTITSKFSKCRYEKCTRLHNLNKIINFFYKTPNKWVAFAVKCVIDMNFLPNEVYIPFKNENNKNKKHICWLEMDDIECTIFDCKYDHANISEYYYNNPYDRCHDFLEKIYNLYHAYKHKKISLMTFAHELETSRQKMYSFMSNPCEINFDSHLLICSEQQLSSYSLSDKLQKKI